jgi:hypothetical protein
VHSTFFGHVAEALSTIKPSFESLRALARVIRPPLLGYEGARSRLAGGFLPTLILMGVNPAGGGTVLVPDTIVVYDVSVLTVL